MVNYANARLDATFGALADSTRRGMLMRLAKGGATVGQLGEPFALSKAAVTKHVKVLESAGLLSREIEGRVHRCKIDPRPLQEMQRYVDQVHRYWEARFDDLAEYLKAIAPKPRKDKR